MPTDWSKSEVEAAVEDYFDMLRSELTGKKYNKTSHRRALRGRLSNRSDGSVELKHQNISAVLIEMGIPYIDGYKPRSNYQRSQLPDAVTAYLTRNPKIQELFRADSDFAPSIPTPADILSAVEHPPQREESKLRDLREAPPLYNPANVNYFEREAQNQLLGDAGERFVMDFERARLIRAGKQSLADRIEHISVTEGPSAGFDILSYEEDGSERLIEAKTTKYGKSTPFFFTPNELTFSKSNAARYYLYRVFRFRADPRMFAVKGELQYWCEIEPSQFKLWPA